MHRKVLNKTKFLDRTNRTRKIQPKKAQETHTDAGIYTFLNRNFLRTLNWKPQYVQSTSKVKQNNKEDNKKLPWQSIKKQQLTKESMQGRKKARTERCKKASKEGRKKGKEYCWISPVMLSPARHVPTLDSGLNLIEIPLRKTIFFPFGNSYQL